MNLSVSEIYLSIQGESSFSGIKCGFIRLFGCNLECKYCDTKHANYSKHIKLSIDEIINKIKPFKCNIVEITGGEPLFQKNTVSLVKRLVKLGYTTLIETNGTLDISNLPKKAVKIMDIKTPCSNMEKKNKFSNLKYLDKKDEIKFVVKDKKDFNYCNRIIKKYNLNNKHELLISPVDSKNIKQAADFVKNSEFNLRLNLQLHKIIWPTKKRQT